MKLRSHTQHKPVIYYEQIAKRNGNIRFRMNGKHKSYLLFVKRDDTEHFGLSDNCPEQHLRNGGR